jgi:hypothetical protein
VTTPQEKYVDKINGLLRKAESTTPEEAELLYAKAAELMAKYQIDEAMLMAKEHKARGTVQSEKFVSVSIWRFPINELKWRVAMAMGLKVIQLQKDIWREVNGKTYKENEVLDIFGFNEDIEMFKMLITSLEIQMMRAENTWWQEHAHLYTNISKSKQHNTRRGFMFAFAQGAASKYTEVGRKAQKQAEAEHGSESVALVLRDKSLEIADAFKSAYPHTKSTSDRKSRGDAYAQSAGYVAGQNADVGQSGVGSGSAKQLNG